MSTNLGEAVLDVRADTSGLKRDLRNAKRETSGSLKQLQKDTDAAAKASGVALLAIGAAAFKATQAASDLDESMNKTRQTFGKAAEEMPGFMGAVATSLGMTRAQALDSAASIGSMLIPMGKSQREAARMSARMVTLAADLGSFHNADPTEMLDRIRAGLSGESEPLKRFGINLSEARVQLEGVRLGLVAQGEQLDDAQKITARYSLIQRDAGAANGDFARTSDRLANQQRILKAELGDLAAQVGSQLIPVGLTLVGVLRDAAGWVRENETTAKVLVATVGGLALAVVTLNAGLRAYTATQTAANVLQSLFVTRTAAATTATVAQTGAQRGLNVAMRANPFGIAATAIALVGTALVIAYQKSETFRRVVSQAAQPVKAAFEVLSSTIGGVVTALDKLLGIGRDIKGFFDALSGGSKTTAKDVAKGLGGIAADARKSGAVVTESGRRFVAGMQTMAEGAKGTSAVVTSFGNSAGKIAQTVEQRWNSAADNVVQRMAGQAPKAAEAGTQVGTSWISGIAAGVSGGQAALDAALGRATTTATAHARQVARVKNPSMLTKEEVGDPLINGVTFAVTEGKKRLTLALTSSVRDAVKAAKQNVASLAGSLGSIVAQAIDARTAGRVKALGNSDDAKALRAIEAQQGATSKQRDEARLMQGASDAAQAVLDAQAALAKATDPDERVRALEAIEDAQRQHVEALQAIDDWRLEQEAQRLRESLALQQTTIEDEEAALRASTERRLSDLTDRFQRGKIAHATYMREVRDVLADAEVDQADVGRLLGLAFATGYRESLAALGLQVKAVARGPGKNVSGTAPDVVRPYNVQHKEWVDRKRALTKRLNDAKAMDPGKARTDAIAAATKALNTWNAREPKPVPLASGRSTLSIDPSALAVVPQYARGVGRVPSDGLAYLHKDETVTPAGGSLVNVEQLVVRDDADAQLVANKLGRYLTTQGVR